MRKNIYSILILLLTVYMYASCDVYKEDVMPSIPHTPVTERTFYTTAQDEVVFNLLSKKEYQSATGFRISRQPNYGTVRFVQQAMLVYTPSGSSTGRSDYFLLDITQNNTTRTDSIFVQITEEDSIPCKNIRIRPDYVTTTQSTLVLKEVLENDQACQGEINTSSLDIIQFPAHGTVAIIQDQFILYNPASGFTGDDYIIYQVCTSTGACGEGYLKVTVQPYSCPNVQFAEDSVRYKRKVLELDSVYTNGLDIYPFANDEICADYIGFNPHATQPAHGTVQFISDTPLEKIKIRYIPQLGYVGHDTFDYFIYDSQAFPPVILAQATVRVQIE